MLRMIRLSSLIAAALLLLPVFSASAANRPWESDELYVQQTSLCSIGAEELWDRLEQSGKRPGEGVTVAVIDTGVSVNADIENNLWTNETELNGEQGVDDDRNGYVDDIRGMSLVNTPATTDTDGHGTMMSGIIAMSAGNGGGVGIAYGARIMPVKIGKTRNFGVDDIIEGINYASDNGADVICMSLGTKYPTDELHEAIKSASKRCILVSSAGNESLCADDSIYQSKIYPAAYPEVIGVMSTDGGGSMSEFTNWCKPDSSIYELAAPGENILSTHLKGEYKSASGTSQSCAAVAAAAAVLRGLLPDTEKYPPSQLQKLLLDNMSHKTAYDEAHGGEHRLLYLPDIWQAYLSLQPEETKPTEALSPTEPAKHVSFAVKSGKTYTAGSKSSRAKYIVKSVKKRTVYYKKCALSKKLTSALIPKSVKLKDGKSYRITGISPKAFAENKKIKTITLKTKLLKKAAVTDSLKGSRVSTVKVKVGLEKQNKKYIGKYRKVFRNCGRKAVLIK